MSAAGLLAALAAIAIYAGLFTVGRHGAANGLDGFDQTAVRFAVSGLLVLPFAWAHAGNAARRLGAGRLLALFVLGGAPYSAVFLGGLVFAPAAYGAAQVPGLQPLAVMAIAALWLAQRPAMPNLVGALVCLGGLALVLLDTQNLATPGGTGTRLLIGVALFVLAAALWGGYAVALKAWKVEPRDVLATTAPLSALLYVPVYLLWHGAGPVMAAPMEALLLQVVYQGGLVGVAALVLYAWAVKSAGSAAVAALAPAMPVMAALFGLFFLGETPSLLQWAGLAVVTTGLLAGTLWPLARIPGYRRDQVVPPGSDRTST